MNWDAIDAISSFVATIATLITLVYLAIQLRDSNKLTRTDSLQNILNGYTDRVLNPILADAEMSDLVDRGMVSWEALEPSERSRFANHQSREVIQVQNIMQLHEGGLLTAIDFEAWVSHVASLLITPGGQIAWGYNRNSITPTVVTLLEKYIEDHPDLRPYTEVHTYRFLRD
jgi:hypothetical protein